MLLGEPRPTQFDLNFPVFGFRVRVSPWFWLVGLLLSGTTDPVYVLLFTVAVFLSILIHELGHCFAFRYFGLNSHIVLYHFGGLAVPEGTYGLRASNSQHPAAQALISLAGPAAQLIFAMIVIALIRVAGHSVPFPHFGFIPQELRLFEGDPIPNELVLIFLFDFLVVSIFWAVLNLLPVYPLDGGQIARNLFLLFDVPNAVQASLMLSIITGGGVAFWAARREDWWMAIMFGMLAFSSFQAMQAIRGGGGGFGGGRFGGGRPW